MAGKAAEEETLGQRVARLRAAAGLTQFTLAEKAGVPVFSLRSWEQDTRRPRAEAAVRLAMELGVTAEVLLAVCVGLVAFARPCEQRVGRLELANELV